MAEIQRQKERERERERERDRIGEKEREMEEKKHRNFFSLTEKQTDRDICNEDGTYSQSERKREKDEQ